MTRRRMLLALTTFFSAAALFASAACSPAPPPSESQSRARPTTSAEPQTTGTPLSAIQLGLDPVVDGFEQPLYVTDAGDGSGRLFVVEQGGRIKVVRDGRISSGDFLRVSNRISTGGERGLLGLEFAADYADSGHFYINFTDRDGATVIERYTAEDPSSDTPKLVGPDRLLRIPQPYPNHNGGCILFGPDGTLWVGMGDGGSAGDPEGRAQNPRSPLGKMLSLDVTEQRPRPRILMSGLRNPWRFTFDRETGDLWIADVGQDAWEEIDYLQPSQFDGANFGWNRWEGTHEFPPGSTQERGDFIFPVAEYGHDEGKSITGGYVYRGARYPALQGAYLYADFVSGWVGALRLVEDGSSRVAENRVMLEGVGNPSSFGEDADGELYLLEHGAGVLYRVTASAR